MHTGAVEEIVVAETFVGSFTSATNGYSGDNASGEFTGGSSATLLDLTGDLVAGEFSVINPSTRMGVLLSAIPDEFQVVSFHPTKGFERTESIKRGAVRGFNFTAYEAARPLVFEIGNFSALALGDRLTLTLNWTGNKDVGVYKDILTYTVQSTTLATELQKFADIINDSSEKVGYMGYSKIHAFVSAGGTELLIAATPVKADYSKVLDANMFYFEVYFGESYDSSSNIKQMGWKQLHPSITLTRGSFNPGFVWTGSTYSPGVFNSAVTASPGHGNPNQVRGHLWETKFGYQGHLNRNRFHDSPYDPVDDSLTYNVITIDHHNPFQRVGEPNPGQAPKRLIIYVPADAGAGPLGDDVADFFKSIIDTY